MANQKDPRSILFIGKDGETSLLTRYAKQLDGASTTTIFETVKYTVTGIEVPAGTTDQQFRELSTDIDSAVFAISAEVGAYEISFKPLMDQAKQAFDCGVHRVVFVCDRMERVQYSQQRFNEISAELRTRAEKIGYKLNWTQVVPVAAEKTAHSNMIVRSDNMVWYRGLSLTEAIDQS